MRCFHRRPLVGCMCVKENSCYLYSSYLLNQIQAFVLMNSMLVALEQAADVV